MIAMHIIDFIVICNSKMNANVLNSFVVQVDSIFVLQLNCFQVYCQRSARLYHILVLSFPISILTKNLPGLQYAYIKQIDFPKQFTVYHFNQLNSVKFLLCENWPIRFCL